MREEIATLRKVSGNIGRQPMNAQLLEAKIKLDLAICELEEFSLSLQSGHLKKLPVTVN